MSLKDDAIEQLAGLQAKLRSLTEAEKDAGLREQMTKLADLLRQSQSQAEQFEPPAISNETLRATIADAVAKVEQNRRKGQQAAKESAAKPSAAKASHAKAKAFIAAAKAKKEASEPAPLQSEFVPPLRESLLKHFGYLGNGEHAKVDSGPDLTEWAMRSALVPDDARPADSLAHWESSILIAADALDERRAVWWSCLAIADLASQTGEPTPPAVEEQMSHACGWVMNPSTRLAPLAAPTTANIQSATPASLLSLAIHFARGQATQFADFVPGPRRVQRAAALAVIHCLRSIAEAPDVERCWRSALELGNDVARGLRLWPSGPVSVDSAAGDRRNAFDSWLNASLGSQNE